MCNLRRDPHQMHGGRRRRQWMHVLVPERSVFHHPCPAIAIAIAIGSCFASIARVRGVHQCRPSAVGSAGAGAGAAVLVPSPELQFAQYIEEREERRSYQHAGVVGVTVGAVGTEG